MGMLARTLFVVALFVIIVESSHNRGGFISWKKTGTRTVTFSLTHAWRAGAQSGIGVYFGDGTYAGLGPSTMIFSGTDQAGEGYYVYTETYTKTYAGDGPYTVYWDGCCRVSTLQNAADGDFRVQTVVDLRGDGYDSPTTSIPPLLQLPISSTTTYQIGVADPNGLPYTCRMATQSESGFSGIPSIGSSQLTVTSGCELRWDTSAGVSGRKYAVGIIISQQGTSTSVPLDFIVELVPAAALPTCTVNSNSDIAAVGKPYTVSVTGTSTVVSALTVSALGLAPGATLTPTAGSSGAVPLTVTLTHTPSAAGAYSTSIVFTDSNRRSTTCSVAYQVAEATNCGLVKYDACAISNGKTTYSLSSANGADSFSWTSSCTGQFDDATDDTVQFQTTTNPNTLCSFSVEIVVAGVPTTCSVNASCPRCVGGTTPRCSDDQEATHVVHAPASVDAYVNGDVLAVVSDADGAIISSTSSPLPPGVGLTADGQFVVVNNAQLVSGTFNATVTTTDALGGTTTQVVTLTFLDIVCGVGLASCGRACFNPDVHDCIISNGERHLCLNGQIICNIQDQCCYDPALQSCIDGSLCPFGNQKCNGMCYNPSERQCLSTVSNVKILCLSGYQICGEGCYDPNVHSCTNGVLCAKSEQVCAGGCFDPAISDCVDNILVPEGHLRCGQTTYSPANHVCLNGHDLCPVGMSLCGNACYHDSIYTCQPDFTLCSAGQEKCGTACFDDEVYECCDHATNALCQIGVNCPC